MNMNGNSGKMSSVEWRVDVRLWMLLRCYCNVVVATVACITCIAFSAGAVAVHPAALLAASTNHSNLSPLAEPLAFDSLRSTRPGALIFPVRSLSWMISCPIMLVPAVPLFHGHGIDMAFVWGSKYGYRLYPVGVDLSPAWSFTER